MFEADDRPLDGIRVLDLSRLLPGPIATWQMRALGAEIWKVEDPAPGDYFRHLPPMLGDQGAAFVVLNRGKKNVVIDLRTASGKEALLALVRCCDVLVEQFRPGVLDRLGLSEGVLRAARPDLVITRITGFGQTGPLAFAAGHDMNYEALAGILELQGTPDGPPVLPVVPAADTAGAQLAVTATLAALFRRQRTGRGATLDVSMTEAIASLGAPFIGASTASGGVSLPRGRSALSGGLANYSTYATRDGRWLAFAPLEPKFFVGFAKVFGDPRWLEVPPVPGPEQEALRREVAAVIAGRTLGEWLAELRGLDLCVSAVLEPQESTEHPHLRARGAITERHVGNVAAAWVDCPLGPAEPGWPSGVGADTDEVFEAAGVAPDDVARLRAAGAFGG